MPAETLTDLADDTYNASRALVRATAPGVAIPAPEAYSVLGNTKNVAFHLAESTRNLSRGLAASPEVYLLTEANPDDDPLDSIAAAAASLDRAAALLVSAGEALAAAQVALAGQGYSGRR